MFILDEKKNNTLPQLLNPDVLPLLVFLVGKSQENPAYLEVYFPPAASSQLRLSSL